MQGCGEGGGGYIDRMLRGCVERMCCRMIGCVVGRYNVLTSGFPQDTVIAMVLSSGLNLMALLRRLLSTCSTWKRSPPSCC